jgi:hypothetical protein
MSIRWNRRLVSISQFSATETIGNRRGPHKHDDPSGSGQGPSAVDHDQETIQMRWAKPGIEARR